MRHQFVDISKIIAFADPSKAQEFKKRNQLAHMAQHNQSSSEGNCCSVQNWIYIPDKDLTSVERAI